MSRDWLFLRARVAVTRARAAAVVRRSNGLDHSMNPHHGPSWMTVHVIAREGWDIKYCFIEPDTWFIGVHR